MSEQQHAPAGWYPDPERSDVQRYWTGTHWADSEPRASDASGNALARAVATITKTNRKLLWLIVGIAALALVGILALLMRGGSHDVTGTIQLTDSYSGFDTTRSDCKGLRGYGDVEAGAQVKITDEGGKTLGIGLLGPGKPGSADYTSTRSYTCEFHFTVNGVGNAKFYNVTIAGRSGPTYSRQDMADAGWKVSLSLG